MSGQQQYRWDGALERGFGALWLEDMQMMKELGVKAGSTILVDRLCDDQWRAKAEAQAKENESYLQLPDPDEREDEPEAQAHQT